MDYTKTGALIAKTRGEKGMTQAELAQALHISHTTVSKWERGVGFPDVSMIEPLADALGLTVKELFSGSVDAMRREQDEADIVAQAVRASRVELAARRRRAILIGAVAVALVACIALCVALFPAKPALRGAYQSDSLANTGHAVLISVDAREKTFVQYIDSREVDRGTFEYSAERCYTFSGKYADGTARVFLVELSPDNSFTALIPGLGAFRLVNISDIPSYIGETYGENLAMYADNEEYRALLNAQ